MAVSGYFPKQDFLDIRNVAKGKSLPSQPYSSIVEEISLERIYKNKWREPPVPFVIYESVCRFHFILDITKVKPFLPEALQKDRVTLFFIETHKQEWEGIFSDWSSKVKKWKDTISITGNRIEATFHFKILKCYCSTKRRSFLQIALKLHDLMFRFLVKDIAVFTHVSQITATGELALSGGTKKLLKSAFWYRKDIFARKKERFKKREKRGDSDEEYLPFEDSVDRKRVKLKHLRNSSDLVLPEGIEEVLDLPLEEFSWAGKVNFQCDLFFSQENREKSDTDSD